MVLIISKTSYNIFSGSLPRWILHEAVFVDDAACGKLCGKVAAPASALSRSRARVRAWGRVPVGRAGRARAGLLEALLPVRARWEAGGEEFALLVMGERDHGCGQGGKPCSCLMGYNSG